MHPNKKAQMQYIFTSIYEFFQRKKAILFSLLILLCILLICSGLRLTFSTDIQKMIPKNEAIGSISNYLKNTKGAEKIVFSISSKHNNASTTELINAKEAYLNIIDSLGHQHIKHIQHEPTSINEQTLLHLSNTYLPIYLSDEDYDKMEQMVQPEAIEKHLEQQIALLQTPAGSLVAQTLPNDPIGMNYLGLKHFATLNNNAYQIIEHSIFSDDTSQIIFFLESNYATGDSKNLKLLQESIQNSNNQLANLFPNLEVNYFGGPIISMENAVQMQEDTIVTLSITIIGLLLLTWHVFKRRSIGLLLMAPVVFGIIFSLGIISFWQHEISALALGVGAIILGIALDFSIHYLNHARAGYTTKEDIQALATPLSLGAFTTIGAFGILTFANSTVLRDIGLFASAALTGASLFTLLFLPHLVDALKIKEKYNNDTAKPTFIDKWASWKPEKNKIFLVIVILLTPIFYYFSTDVKFNGDLMSLNYMSDEMKNAENKLQNKTNQTLRNIYIISSDTNEGTALNELNAASKLLDSLQQTGLIDNYINPSQFFAASSQQNDRANKWRNFWTNDRLTTTQNAISNTAKKLGINEETLLPIEEIVNQKKYNYEADDVNLLQTLMPISISKFTDSIAYIASVQTTPENRKVVLDLLSNTNPNLIVTDNQSSVEKLLEYLKEDFNNLAFYSGLLVFIALLIAYGRIELALIAFLPMAISWIWILGIMALLGLEFNIVNIIICTLIFGLGDDYSIFMMDGLVERYKTGNNKLLLSRSAIYLSALTTIIGLGVLIFAKHPALKGIALTAVIGIVCVVILAQILQPYLFQLLIQGRANKGKMPFTLWSLSKSIFAFSYFLLGCLLLTVVGFLLVYLKPLGKQRSKYVFHYLLSKYTKSVLYIMTNTKKSYNYIDKNYHKEPAIYIANHSSFLDILITIGLHPKVILVTADWVWKSPVMGKIVKMAEFYPATEGAIEGLDKLAMMRDQGYSIVIFPEGTRSTTDKMLKFKKGAFFLAEQLNMKIQPIILHGVANTMEKNDFLLKDGQMNVYVLDKISIKDELLGNNLASKRKNIAKWYKEQYALIKEKHEIPSYFRETLIKSHLYKGPILEWYCRVKTKLENNYDHFDELLPKKGCFYDLGCGYGFMTFMLHWSGERRFIGIDYDSEKIACASNNYYFNTLRYKQNYPELHKEDFGEGLSFRSQDLTLVNLKPCDGILLMDALHYMIPEEQETLLKKCYDALLPGGVLLVRDGIMDDSTQYKNTQRTEQFSTKIFKFNKTKQELYFLDQAKTIQFFEQLGADVQCKNFGKHLNNITFIIHKPQ